MIEKDGLGIREEGGMLSEVAMGREGDA